MREKVPEEVAEYATKVKVTWLQLPVDRYGSFPVTRVSFKKNYPLMDTKSAITVFFLISPVTFPFFILTVSFVREKTSPSIRDIDCVSRGAPDLLPVSLRRCKQGILGAEWVALSTGFLNICIYFS